MTVTVEHLGAEYFQDSYSVHARLRAQRAVSRVIMPGATPAWLVTGYPEARAALADPRLLKMPPDWRPGGRDRLLSPAGEVRLDAAGGARRVVALAAEHAHPRPGVAAGAARSLSRQSGTPTR